MRTFDRLEGAHLRITQNRYTPRWLPELIWQTNCVEWLAEIEPQIVFLQPTPRMVTNFSAVRWAKRSGVPVMGWGMGQMPGLQGRREQVHNLLVTRLVGQLDGMVCYSSPAARYYERLGLAADRIFVAHNSLDTDECRQQADALADMRWKDTWLQEHKLDSSKPILICVGRMIESKRVDQLLQTVRQIDTPLQLVLVGDGPARQGLEAMSAENSLDCRFLGHQEGASLAKAFLASDFFVLPSLGGLAIQHAMAYGKPVIVSVGDGTEEDLVEDGVNGFLFERNDWDGLRSCIMRMLEARETWTAMGQRSREVIEKKVNLHQMLTVFTDVIDQMTGAQAYQ